MAVTDFTPREIDVLVAMKRGASSYQAIARSLDPPVSPRTAQDLVYSIVTKIPTTEDPPLMRAVFWARSALSAVPDNSG